MLDELLVAEHLAVGLGDRSGELLALGLEHQNAVWALLGDQWEPAMPGSVRVTFTLAPVMSSISADGRVSSRL